LAPTSSLFPYTTLFRSLGLLIRRVDFKELFFNLSGTSYATLNDAKVAGAPTLNYGLFVNTVIEFLLIAFALFLIVRTVNRWRQQDRKSTRLNSSHLGIS